MKACLSLLAVAGLLATSATSRSLSVTVTVDASKDLGALPPIWRFFGSVAGRLWCFYGRRGIQASMKKRGEQPTAEEGSLLELLDRLVADPTYRLDMQLQAGDVLFVNNYSVLHARTAYEDYEDPERWRLLLRLWLNLNDIELPPRLARFTRAGFAAFSSTPRAAAQQAARQD
jgi:hypothetical protein